MRKNQSNTGMTSNILRLEVTRGATGLYLTAWQANGESLHLLTAPAKKRCRTSKDPYEHLPPGKGTRNGSQKLKDNALPIFVWNTAAKVSPDKHIRQTPWGQSRQPRWIHCCQLKNSRRRRDKTNQKGILSYRKYTGSFHKRIPGTIYEAKEEDFNRTDHYEGDQYERIQTILESGRRAWVYVEAKANSQTNQGGCWQPHWRGWLFTQPLGRTESAPQPIKT